MAATAPNLASLKGTEILVAVCGGIAAYKVADLVSRLVQAGAGVSVVMTQHAQQFVTPVTFQALSGRPVSTELFYRAGTTSPDHLGLTERAAVMLVAPATGNARQPARTRGSSRPRYARTAANARADDDHPTAAGGQKATGEFLPLLNIAYHRWIGQ